MIYQLGIVVAVLVISAWLGRRASPSARAVLWASALVVSAGMFLPSSLLRDLVGPQLLAVLTAHARAVPGGLGALSHFIAFFWLAGVAWILRPDLRGWKLIVALIVLAVAGELMQELTADRSPRVGDVVVNLAGAGAGLVLAGISALLLHRWRQLRARSS